MSTPGVSFGTTNMLKPRLRRASWLVRVKTRRNARCRNGSTEGMRFKNRRTSSAKTASSSAQRIRAYASI
jgi:hypothetical protein